MTTTSTVWLGARPGEERARPDSDPLRTTLAYRTAIRMVVGDEPIGAYLRVLRTPLSHTDPFEVAIEFDPTLTEARTYAEAALDAEQKKLENGKSTSFLVLQAQRDLTARSSDEIRALADYNKALAQLALNEGTTLERNKLSVDIK